MRHAFQANLVFDAPDKLDGFGPRTAASAKGDRDKGRAARFKTFNGLEQIGKSLRTLGREKLKREGIFYLFKDRADFHKEKY